MQSCHGGRGVHPEKGLCSLGAFLLSLEEKEVEGSVSGKVRRERACFCLQVGVSQTKPAFLMLEYLGKVSCCFPQASKKK